MFNYIDLIVVIIFLAAVIVEAKRGFGKAVFDAAGILVAVKAAPGAASWLAKHIKFSATAGPNEAVNYALFFVIVGVTLVLLGRLLYSTTLISAEVFEPILGGVCGIIIGIVLCHAYVRTIWLASGADEIPMVIVNSLLGNEMLTFSGYHDFIERLHNIGGSMPE